MNALSIALKEMKHDIRDKRNLVFMLAFPIVLMVILGLALNNAFSSSATVGDLKVLVNNTSTGMLAQSFGEFAKAAEPEGITFVTASADTDGQKEVRLNHDTAYVELSDSGMKLYTSESNLVESNIVEGMLRVFADKYNAAAAVAAVDPAKAASLFNDGGADYVKETSIVADREPGSVDYYAMAMAVMLALWGAFSAGFLIRREVVRGTAARLIAAPVKKADIFIGKVIGGVALNFLCVLILILFSKYVLDAYWGEHPLAVCGVLLSEVIMSVSFGLAVSYIVKEGSARGILMLIVQLASFFGGAYFPVQEGDGGGFMQVVSHLSPIRWANDALTEMIYGGHLTEAWRVMGLNLALAAGMLALSGVLMSRREGL